MEPLESGDGPYPGLYLFTGAARMLRPVLQLKTGKRELIGPLEQVFLEIACLPDDVKSPGGAGIPCTHQELDPTNMLSLIAALTPFSDYNQVFAPPMLAISRSPARVPCTRVPVWENRVYPCIFLPFAGTADHVPMPDGEADYGNPVPLHRPAWG